jgi:hypothetical protein
VSLIKTNIRALQQNVAHGRHEVSLSDWSKFLESNTARLTKCPGLEDTERERLFEALCRALHQNVSCDLRYEACKLIIESDTYQLLGRWDALQFKDIIAEVLDKGSEEQMDVVSQYFARIGQIDARIIDQFKDGLGNLDDQKRNTSLTFYCLLGSEYVELLIPTFLKLGDHMNWKVKFDVIIVLSYWIPRLMPPPSQPPLPRDPDALETDTDELIKKLFHTLGIMSNDAAHDAAEQHGGRPNSARAQPVQQQPVIVDEEAELELKRLNLRKQKHVDSCINLLLELMWTGMTFLSLDQNLEVKAKATQTLGELKQGKPVYDWIIRHLTSHEPLKRVEALRCIASLGVIARLDMPVYLQCFNDPYASVRIEACKAACVLKSCEREMVNTLLDRFDDSDFKVRAYAIKGTWC